MLHQVEQAVVEDLIHGQHLIPEPDPRIQIILDVVDSVSDGGIPAPLKLRQIGIVYFGDLILFKIGKQERDKQDQQEGQAKTTF